MLNAADQTQMQSDLVSIRDDNPISIVIRRGDITLAAQTVRVAGVGGRGRRANTASAEASIGSVIVAGASTLDIQPDDRFTHNGILYNVTFVQPTRLMGVTAEANAIE